MKRKLCWTCAVFVFLFAGGVFIWPQGSNEKGKPKQDNIQGDWTQISMERDGELFSSLPCPLPHQPGMLAGGFLIWQISKKKMTKATHEYAYELDPGNKQGWIDVFPLDKEGKKTKQGNAQGIYLLKDAYLLICVSWGGKKRPEAFSTSKENPGTLFVLRRCELELKKKVLAPEK